jgi:DNA-directed RNA polymerase specialized sigma24 family protein
VSPATLRRYRAERLLRDEFEGLRGRVIATARGRLLASGVCLDRSDLDACYAQAWQGLYTAVLDGHEIANPAGWLVLVTFRRAIEEHRSRRRTGSADVPARDPVDDADGGWLGRRGERAPERDLADELDDRMRLRQLFEGMRGRLSARELQAATLCYLHGLTRAEAAERMGVSEARMRKLMEGEGADRPGVAGKIGTLVETIRQGRWCAEQASLMRGYAYGILDPEGERYRLARAHRDECPACRAYVVSLRGLAAVLPPVFPPWPLAAALLAGAGAQAGGAAGGALGASGAAGAGAGGAAGAGTAAGGPMLASGSLAGKLVAGCLLAFGVGVGCVALNRPPGHAGRAHVTAVPPRRGTPTLLGPVDRSASAAAATAVGGAAHPVAGPQASTRPARSAASVREFRPEQAAGAAPAATPTGRPAARIASAPSSTAHTAATAAGGGGAAWTATRAGAVTAAQREFGAG